jgi:hypothetical protein
MYLRDGFLLVMSNGAVAPDGSVRPRATVSYPGGTGGSAGGGTTTTSTTDGDGALVMAIDVQNPGLATLATLQVPGEIADSRVVGSVLYLATYENTGCYGCGTTPRTMVTSFDISSATGMQLVEQVSFQSNAPDGYNLPWGSNWKRSIFVTDQRLYIGGHADIDPSTLDTKPQNEGIIDVLDVTDPTGRLGVGARINVAGAILSRWQLDERDGILRVISQQGAGRTGNGIGAPVIDTFTVTSARNIVPLGETVMTLPRQEGLRTVRFDAQRAYAITYNQTDPMFVIDLSDPRHPAQRGALYMPGFMFYLEPHGNRVIGLGIDRTDTQGSLNVSLFDVSNPSQPAMIKRVSFGTPGITEDYEILNSEVSEDQDRIQKAFRVLPDGLVVAPFSGLHPYYAQTSGSACVDDGSGVQLVSWTNDTLVKHALLPLPGNPRRAFEHGQEIVTVSDSNVRSFGMANLDVAHQTADLNIGTCVPDMENTPYNYGGGGVVNPPPGGYRNAGSEGGYPLACAVGPGGRGGTGALPAFLAVALLALPRLRRAARARR